ncbi:hypothetical protein [Bradyrhizobium sp. 143]|uniref:hypothetical protein n=1 Tax=Bradyrhizobium sp. 143 TaxID=2782619 RepID=UPI001FF9D514|nr:hypothetical protein [Bradyrhizobium sp. 143]MCK1711372.1 hypothetical protein [Bradyrhizobium sp. 143]
MEVYTREGLKIDLGTLIEGNTAFEPDKPAIHFEGGKAYGAFRAFERGARGLKARVDLHEQLIRLLSAEGLQIKCDN